MSLSRRTPLLAVASMLLLGSAMRAQPVPDPSGRWEGQIQIPGHVLNMTVDIARRPTGAWIGSMTILGSTAVDVPLDSVTVDHETVRFAAGLPDHASFDGVLSTDSQALAGTASNAQGGVPFELTRRGDAHVSVPPPNSPLPPAFEGTWEGTLESAGQPHRVRIKLTRAADGTGRGTLISVDKGNIEIPVTTVTVHDSQLELDARSISGTYRGTLGADGTIAGEWTESTLHVSLTLTRAASALEH
jgi:hypothetical protein